MYIGEKQCRDTLFVPYTDVGKKDCRVIISVLYYMYIGDKQCTLCPPY